MGWEILKAIQFLILGLLWMIQTTIGDFLHPIFYKAIDRKRWILVAIIAIIMIPVMILNAITTPWLERNGSH